MKDELKKEIEHFYHYVCDDDNYGHGFGFRSNGDTVTMHEINSFYQDDTSIFGADQPYDAFLFNGGNHSGDSWKFMAVVASNEMLFVHDDPRAAPPQKASPPSPLFLKWMDVMERLQTDTDSTKKYGVRRSVPWLAPSTQLPEAQEVRRKMKM